MATAWSPPFFTQVDPEIAVKGSVDPLGMQPLWTRYGREVVGNLTTVASSARGFSTVLLGYHLARQALDAGLIEEAQFVDAFMVVEQLVAYSRLARAADTGDPVGRILGIRRARARYTDGKGKAFVGPTRDEQIMSNQKAYGLWGLFSVAAEDSGLLERKQLRLARMGEAIVDETVRPTFQRHGLKDGAAIARLVAKAIGTPQRFEPTGKHAAMAEALAELHAPTFAAAEQPLYRSALVHAEKTLRDGRQRCFWEILRAENDGEGEDESGWGRAFGMAELRGCIARAEELSTSGPDDVYELLAQRLEQIRRFEQIAGPMARLFSALLGWDDWPVAQAIDDVREVWGPGLEHIEGGELGMALAPVAELHGEEGVARMTRFRDAVRAGDYRTALLDVIAQNGDVMGRRRGGAWVEVTADDRIKIRYRSEPAALPQRDELPDLWEHPYFLGSLKQVGAEVMNLLPRDAPSHLEAMQEDDD